MYILSIVSIIILAIVTLYTLISCGKSNPIIIAIIIPITLASGSFSIYTLHWYRGMPIEGFPEEIVTVKMTKVEHPTILIVAQRDDEDFARLWAVPYTKDNAQVMNKAEGSADGQMRGRFGLRKAWNNSEEQFMNFEVEDPEYEAKETDLPNKPAPSK